jgi:hypothetical protein
MMRIKVVIKIDRPYAIWQRHDIASNRPNGAVIIGIKPESTSVPAYWIHRRLTSYSRGKRTWLQVIFFL